MRLLCIAAKNGGYILINEKTPDAGALAYLFRQEKGDVERWLKELETNGVVSRDGRKILYSRRMLRESFNSIKNRINGEKGGNPNLLKTKRNPISHKAESETESETESYKQNSVPKDVAEMPIEKRGWAALARFIETRTDGNSEQAKKFIGKLKRDNKLDDEQLFRLGEMAWKRGDPKNISAYLISAAREIAAAPGGERPAFQADPGADPDWYDLEAQESWLRQLRDDPNADWPGYRGGPPGSETCRVDPRLLVKYGHRPPSWAKSNPA